MLTCGAPMPSPRGSRGRSSTGSGAGELVGGAVRVAPERRERAGPRGNPTGSLVCAGARHHRRTAVPVWVGQPEVRRCDGTAGPQPGQGSEEVCAAAGSRPGSHARRVSPHRGRAKAPDRLGRRTRLAAGENEPPRLTAPAPGNRANAPWGAVRPDHGARPEALVAGGTG